MAFEKLATWTKHPHFKIIKNKISGNLSIAKKEIFVSVLPKNSLKQSKSSLMKTFKLSYCHKRVPCLIIVKNFTNVKVKEALVISYGYTNAYLRLFQQHNQKWQEVQNYSFKGEFSNSDYRKMLKGLKAMDITTITAEYPDFNIGGFVV